MKSKAEIRKEVLARRNAIPISNREQKSIIICESILRELSLAFSANGKESQENSCLEGKTIAVYATMGSEVSLDYFIRKAYTFGAHLCFPSMTRKRQTLSFSEELQGQKSRTNVSRETLMIFRQVSESHYEAATAPFIIEPLRSSSIVDPTLDEFPPVPPNDIDVVIVPIVAFDPQLNRLGYGGGNYDGFLPQLQPDTLIIGVAFEEQQVSQIPFEKHDHPLPHIIST